MVDQSPLWWVVKSHVPFGQRSFLALLSLFRQLAPTLIHSDPCPIEDVNRIELLSIGTSVI